MVNLHFSLLPRWRGAAPVERAILAGDDVTGVDLMAVEEGLDTGGIYRRVEVPIGPDETLGELRDRLVAEGTRLLVDALASGLGEPAPQVGEPTYAEKLRAEDRQLDWSAPAIDVHRRVRLADAWTTHLGKRLKVWRTHVPPDGRRPPGDGGRRRRSSSSRCSPRARRGCRPEPGRTGPVGEPATASARDVVARASWPSTPSTASSATAPTPTCSCPTCSTAAGSRPATATSSPSSSTARPACGGPATSSSTASSPASSTCGSGTPCGSAPTSCTSSACHRTRRWARRSRWRPSPRAAWSTRCCAGSSGAPVTWPDDATRLSYPDWIVEHLRRRPRVGGRARRPRGDEHRAAGDRAGRRLRAGPRVAVGRRRGRRARRASGSPTSAPRRAARRRRWRPPARPSSRPTSARPASASSAANAPELARAGRRRRPPAVPAGLVRPRPRSTPRAPASARCAAVPTPAGASTPRRPSASAAVQRSLVDAAAPLLRPGGTLVYSVCTLTDAETTGDRRPPRVDHRRSWCRRAAARWPLGARRAAAAASCRRPPTPTACTSSACAPPPERRPTTCARSARSTPAPRTPSLCSICAVRRRWNTDCGGGGRLAGMAWLAKVITVSDGVVAGTREDRSGQALEQHLAQAGLRRGRAHRHGRRRRRRGRRPCGGLRRVRRTRRHDRRHRVRAAGPHPRGHARRRSSARRRASPRPCAS